MKRFFIGALVAVTLLIPAAAQAQTLGDAYVAAHEIFGAHNFRAVTDRLDGEWLQLSRLANQEMATAQQIDEYTRFCGDQRSATVAIQAQGESFNLRQFSPQRELKISFAWIGGSSFMRSFDPQHYVEFLGLDRDDERFVEQRAQ